MLNVHASLLPRWRGAAPIIYAIANGDKQTGVTIMRIKPDKFDVGDIVTQSTIELSQDVTLPEVHKQLSNLGANTLIHCIQNLSQKLNNCKKQPEVGVTLGKQI